MPERYTITLDAERLQRELNVEVPDNYEPRFNAAPAQLLPVITSNSKKGLSYFYWGTLPGWAANKSISQKIITLDTSQLNNKPTYKKLLIANRCVVPADGFYIWKKVGKRTRIPYRVERNDKALFLFAGLWEEFEDENDKIHHVFKILVSNTQDGISELDGSSPVVLSVNQMEKWLDSSTEEPALIDMLQPLIETDYTIYTVSSKIEEQQNDHPGLIQRVESMNQFGNYSLFD